MKVSVVTPVFNSKNTIRACIESCLGQKNIEVEHLLMDAGSTDGTLDLIRSYAQDPRIKWDSRKDKGIYDGMNRGIREASGDWVMFLGADDQFFSTNSLSEVLLSIDPHQTDLVLGGARPHDAVDDAVEGCSPGGRSTMTSRHMRVSRDRFRCQTKSYVNAARPRPNHGHIGFGHVFSFSV